MMRDTSLDAYSDIKPHLGKAQSLIFGAISTLGCPTDLEIAKFLHLSDPNKVRPRRNELCKAGLITECEKRVCSVSQRTVWSWRVV